MTPLDITLLLALVVILTVVTGAAERRGLRTHRIERKIDALLDAGGVLQDVFPRPSDRVVAFIQAGDLKQAIRTYRSENPGMQLKDAHDVIVSIGQPDRPRRADLGRVEHKIDVLLRANGLEHVTRVNISDAVRTHIAAGRLIDAIALMRAENPALSLTEARDIARGLR